MTRRLLRARVGAGVGILVLTPALTGVFDVVALRPTAPPATDAPAAVAPAPAAPDGPPRGAVPALRVRDLAVSAPAPTLITIDAIGVAAPVGPVGVKPNGQLEVFDDVTNVGWFRDGPVPGAAGSAVLAAHVDHWRDGAGVFFELRNLDAGDTIAIAFADGSSREFRVVSNDEFPRDALPTAELFRPSGEPVLTLITCGGSFDRERRSYRDNVVVRAVPV